MPKEKKTKSFTLRCPNLTALQTLKTPINAQLDADLDDVFHCGYILGITVVSPRSSKGIQEVWSSILKGKNIMLWCDGLHKEHQSGAKKWSNKSMQEESDDDDEIGR